MSFLVLALKLRTLIYFELTFVYAMKYVSKFILLTVNIQLSQHPLTFFNPVCFLVLPFPHFFPSWVVQEHFYKFVRVIGIIRKSVTSHMDYKYFSQLMIHLLTLLLVGFVCWLFLHSFVGFLAMQCFKFLVIKFTSVCVYGFWFPCQDFLCRMSSEVVIKHWSVRDQHHEKSASDKWSCEDKWVLWKKPYRDNREVGQVLCLQKYPDQGWREKMRKKSRRNRQVRRMRK